MILLTIVSSAIGRWLRRAVMALAQPAPHSDRDVPSDYYRFPPF
jgi:hypothetical protein